MKTQTLGFIGAGNMASSLIGGLISDGYPAENIVVSDVDAAKLKDLAARFGVQTFENNRSSWIGPRRYYWRLSRRPSSRSLGKSPLPYRKAAP
jgi:hypothetical protein